MSEQLGIPGIGQQLASLKDWKIDHQVYTHHAPHMPEQKWCAWRFIENPSDALSEQGDDWWGFGESEKSAIIDLCEKYNLKLPFWWEVSNYRIERKEKGWVVMNGNHICNDWIHKTPESAERYKLELEILFGGRDVTAP